LWTVDVQVLDAISQLPERGRHCQLEGTIDRAEDDVVGRSVGRSVGSLVVSLLRLVYYACELPKLPPLILNVNEWLVNFTRKISIWALSKLANHGETRQKFGAYFELLRLRQD
jgi:hypothetical protein